MDKDDLDEALEVLADSAEERKKPQFDDLSEKDEMKEEEIIDAYQKAVKIIEVNPNPKE